MDALYAGTVDKLPKLDSPTLWAFLIGVGVVAVVVLLIIRPVLAFYKYVFLLMFVFYAAYLLTVTFSGDFNDVEGGVNTILFDTINRYQFGSRQFFNNIIGNVLMMVPYGLFLGIFMHKGSIRPLRVIWAMFLIGLTPVLIELGQHVVGRVFDVDDVVLNWIGGLSGYLIYFAMRLVFWALPGALQARWLLNLGSVILVIVLVASLQWLGIITS